MSKPQEANLLLKDKTGYSWNATPVFSTQTSYVIVHILWILNTVQLGFNILYRTQYMKIDLMNIHVQTLKNIFYQQKNSIIDMFVLYWFTTAWTFQYLQNCKLKVKTKYKCCHDNWALMVLYNASGYIYSIIYSNVEMDWKVWFKRVEHSTKCCQMIEHPSILWSVWKCVRLDSLHLGLKLLISIQCNNMSRSVISSGRIP